MLFLTLEDLHGRLDAILFPDAYHAAKFLLGSSAPLLVTGIMEMGTNRGEPFYGGGEGNATVTFIKLSLWYTNKQALQDYHLARFLTRLRDLSA